jgi:uncharacterized protein (TIGR03435 family)
MKSIGPCLLLLTTAIPCFSQQAPAFSVATFKPAKGDGQPILRPLPDGFRGTSLTMHMLIANAFENSRLEGEPAWANIDRYDFEARLDSTQAELRTPSVTGAHVHTLNLALQQLLKDRCGLRTHMKSTSIPAYALVVLAGGPRLKADKPNDPDLPNGTLRLLRGQITGQGVSIHRLADLLSMQLGRPVLDRTQLADRYDFTLHWQEDGSPEGKAPVVMPAPPSAEDSRAEIPSALEKQLGLKLVPARTTVEVLAIDHLERPSAN